MYDMYDLLFNPVTVGSLEIKNRFVVPAMDSHYTAADHQFTEQALNYYGERAKGDFGLIITEYLCVSEEGLASQTQGGIYDDRFIPMLSKLAGRIHEEGAHTFAQLHHAGRVQGMNCTDLQPVGASSLPDRYYQRTIHELTTDEIQPVKKKFVEAAIRAKKAGFDGVEIHGAHGYLLAQFLSKGMNKRVDAYGGSLTNRARIVCELIEEIKAACGSDYPVIVRTSGDEAYDGGNTIEDAKSQAMLFEQAGADAINVSYGRAIESYYVKAGFNMENVRRVKEVVDIPVIGVGRFNDPTLILSAVKSGSMDMVALGRQSICDPHFPEKVVQNRLDEILTCTGCMQRCLYSDSFEEGFGTSCMINPFSGKEGLWTIDPAEQKKNIAVIGAGPAGLQAAWILGKRGHLVTVYEKSSTPGGQYRLDSVPAMKQNLGKTISTYLTFCQKNDVKLLFDQEATKDVLEKAHYDEIVIATGSLPIIPGIPGIDSNNVYTANDILQNKYQLTQQKILVLGAGLVGAETAEFLAGYQNRVTTMVDMIDKVAPLAPGRPREGLMDRLDEFNVEFIPNCKVLTILKDGVECEKDGSKIIINGFDSIVLAFGYRPNAALYEQLRQGLENVHVVGDARKASDARDAIFEATQLAMVL